MSASDKVVLLTGATGFIGSYLLRDLLQEGHTAICLARGSKGVTAQERLEKTLLGHEFRDGVKFSQEQIRALFSQEGLNGARVRVVDSDLKTLGEEAKTGKEGEIGRLERATREVLTELGVGKIDAVVLNAAALGMRQEEREESELVNVHATEGLLGVVSRLKTGGEGESQVEIGEVDTIGTIYMYGTEAPANRILRGEEIDAWARVGHFPNPYTETKHRQARAAADRCRESGLRHNLHLFSIVGGDPSRSTFGFNAFMKFAGNRLLGPLLEGCLRFGVKIPFPGQAEARLDVVDVEDIVARVVKVIHHGAEAGGGEGKIYYHTNPNPEILGELMVKILNHYGYDGQRVVREVIEFTSVNNVGEILTAFTANIEKKSRVLGELAKRVERLGEKLMGKALGELEPLFFVLSGETFPPAKETKSFRSYPFVEARAAEDREWLGDKFRTIDREYLAQRYPLRERSSRPEHEIGLPLEVR